MKLTIYQCQSKASKGSKFLAYFPAETVECEWVDPEMGTLRVNLPNLSDGLLTSEMIDKRYPDLLVSEPYEKGEKMSATDILFDAFDDAICVRPHLIIEIGYTRPTDWMVHIWDSTRVGIKDAKKIISTQDVKCETACVEAADKLREYIKSLNNLSPAEVTPEERKALLED